MPRFSVGDRVMVVTRKWDTKTESQFGCTGVVVKARESRIFTYEVMLDQMRKNVYNLNYYESDLELEKSHFEMADPDMSLDEIHKAQELCSK